MTQTIERIDSLADVALDSPYLLRIDLNFLISVRGPCSLALSFAFEGKDFLLFWG